MLTGRIDFTGHTESDVEFAIEEALKRIQAGNIAGFDRNDTGSFAFEISEETETT